MLQKAWLLVLEPFERSAVKQALLDLLRRSEHFPDPQKIAVLCPTPCGSERKKSFPAGGFTEEEKQLHAEWQALVERRRAAGIPADAQEAQREGLSNVEWLDMLERHGLQFRMGWKT